MPEPRRSPPPPAAAARGADDEEDDEEDEDEEESADGDRGRLDSARCLFRSSLSGCFFCSSLSLSEERAHALSGAKAGVAAAGDDDDDAQRPTAAVAMHCSQCALAT
mmetsp:Transcript_15878/g.42004  ORF Transcript_15878/g.42004 Transcript_15878/m.42004 type:complete len:107 (+) Transcript_15878:1791-2111(+)